MDRRILPFYLVVDTSGSLQGSPIASINVALRELHRTVTENPMTANLAHLGVIGFSDAARVILPLSNLQTIPEIPSLKASGATAYSGAFECLYREIDKNIGNLKANDVRVYRPVVFFVSDGQPTDGGAWMPSYSRLMDWPWHPKIVTFGIGNADPGVLIKIATDGTFMQNQGISLWAGIDNLFRALTSSIIQSTTPGSDQTLRLAAPVNVPGFQRIYVE